ncbi:MAG: CoA transferase [Deltaproteobacteria bacterium]
MRVIDLTTMISGPMATMMLAEQGADVIKVEAPGTGDLIRYIGCSAGGISAIFATLNRGKRSVALDLKSEEGRRDLLRLAATADVFVQNSRPGVVERMGLGEDEVRQVAPDIIYVSINGFGESGPYSQWRVYDVVIQALSGMAASQSNPKTGDPELVRNVVCDKITSLYAAQAITAALLARERGGDPSHVRLSMLDAAIAFLWPDVMQAETLVGDDVTRPAPLSEILSVAETRDGHVALIAVSDAEFAGLCRAMDMPELIDDPRFIDLPARAENAREVVSIVKDHARTRTTDEFCKQLHEFEVPAAHIVTVNQVVSDPQVSANKTVCMTEHPAAGPVRTPRGPARFGRPSADAGPAPLLGQHTEEVLAGLAKEK